jgi:Uncharacterised nucleotidyltransferase
VLIAAIHPGVHALDDLLSDRRVIASLDWDWLIDRAQTHRVAALVASRLQSAAGDGLPDAVRTRLDDIKVQAAQRAAAAQATLRELAAALQVRGVPFLLIKGSVLAELVYADPLIRPFYDVDVIVRRESLPAAEALLRAWNYHLEGVWSLLGPRPSPPVAIDRAEAIARQSYLRIFHNLSYAPERGDRRRPIELHWNIVPRGRLRVREEQLWERTTTAQVAGVDVRTLDGEAMLIHLAVHALDAWFHGFKLLHLNDVAWTVARRVGQYRDLWELADAWGAAYHLELALRLVDQLSPVPAAAALLEGRRPSQWMRTALRVAGREQVLIDGRAERRVTPQHSWARRAAVEVGWGLAVRGMRAKLGFSVARRGAAARWRLARRR